MDFQKHYRLPAVHLMDTNRVFEKRFNRDGWPFLMLVDAAGRVSYQCNNLADSDKSFKQELNKIREGSQKPKIQNVDGVNYMVSTLNNNTIKADSRNDRFASLAAGKDGRVYTVFTSSRNGNSHIMLREYDGKVFLPDKPIAAADADEYDGFAAADKNGRVWICWTSNQTGRYNIFMTSLERVDAKTAPIQVSDAADDAMHSRCAVDSQNGIWITYYQWHKMQETSRDKEIYLRRYAENKLSKEIRVSPKDVPTYEDHTDPAISILGDKTAVCWSWDYHKPKGYPQDCESPTVFVQIVNPDLTFTRPFPLSGQDIDSMPAMSPVIGDKIWCAWDSLGSNRQKRLCVRAFTADGADGTVSIVSDKLVHLCLPSFAVFDDKKASLVWSQTADGNTWSLCRSEYDFQKRSWKEKQVLESQNKPRYGSAVYDSYGNLWIGYSIETQKGREIVVKKY